MHEDVTTEILTIARAFYRLMDPRISTHREAVAVTEVSGQVMQALASAYQMDRPARDALLQRLFALSEEVLAERQVAVH